MDGIYTIADLRSLIDTAKGRKKASLIVKGVTLINVITRELEESVDIAVQAGRIVSIGRYDDLIGDQTIVIDGKGLYAGPGYIDSHMHIESSLLTPENFSRLALPLGTTSVFADPHEIENTCGLDGLEYFVDSAGRLPLKVFITEASCVPAKLGFETTGGEITGREIDRTVGRPGIVGLGEVMDYQGIIDGDERLLGEVVSTLNHAKVVQGHAPLVTGRDLNAYLSAGITSDHECTRKDETLEKLRRGMTINVRESSIAHDVKELVRTVTETGIDTRHLLLCTDDVTASDMFSGLHMNHVLERVIEEGVDPLVAYQMASINAAEYYKMADVLGSISPFKVADMVLLEGLTKPSPRLVIAGGEVVARDGRLTVQVPAMPIPEKLKNTIKLKAVTPETFRIQAKGRRARIIKLIEETGYTVPLIEDIDSKDGEVVLNDGVAKVAVLERYGKTGGMSKGLVKGFNIVRKGAVASTFSHDSHNVIVVGSSDADMALAVNRIIEIQGGMVLVRNGEVAAQLELPVGGILSDEGAPRVIEKEKLMLDAWRTLGCELDSPSLYMSELTLSVVPEFRITDKGLLDTVNFRFLNLFVD
ncbi:MAG: adenine deaminase [Nitrososphaerota archaeon]|jgi:adenine deaminase|nr:adenine deaminase [Nitrososphaerota archaeon]MDG7039119.1 adenine deaminase [Nitrososphaerota archaeon]MDG7042655.1 adenine deaminase [Nitrososphaerota archaeon]